MKRLLAISPHGQTNVRPKSVFASIFVGSILSTLTVGIHAMGTAWWIRCLRRTKLPEHPRSRKLLPMRLLCSTALLLLLLHIAEILPWSITYMLLPGNEKLSGFDEACYFATVTFSSLGYGDIVISGPWKMLSAIQAMTGLLVFGWSTALLFAVVERIWGDQASTPSAATPQHQRTRPVRVHQFPSTAGHAEVRGRPKRTAA